MCIKKQLSFTSLRKQISKRLSEIPDNRQEGKVQYPLHDCFMSGFAIMFFQDPSLLAFQRRMQEVNNLNNLKTVFQIEAIPGDSQLRSVLDQYPGNKLEEVFGDYFRSLQRGKHLEGYQFLPGQYLILLDGSEYFSSEKISCPGCLRQTPKKGPIHYHLGPPFLIHTRITGLILYHYHR